MTAIALALALAAQQPGPPTPSWFNAWRLVNRPDLHIGLRPAAFIDNETSDGSWEVGAGATLQVTLHFPL